jgi:hypothetical protein
MFCRLHPFDRSSPLSVSAALRRRGLRLQLAFSVRGGCPEPPLPGALFRADELWRHTCLELFAGVPGADGYLEFNFAPDGRWNSYRFAAYRDGMAKEGGAALHLVKRTRLPEGWQWFFDAVLPEDVARIPLLCAPAAIIEEESGALQYFAPSHPDDRPDFHSPALRTVPLLP